MLYGDSGNDTLFGGGGDDVINGGVGHDELTGGSGRGPFFVYVDRFSLGGLDILHDLVRGTDRLRIQRETPDTNGDGRINGSDSFSSITTITGETGLPLLTDWAFGWFSEDPTFIAGVTQFTVSDITP